MDIYKEITERIITEMEKGIIPWEKPWIASGNCVAHTTGKPYSLLNQMLLGRPGEYITFNQCQKEGGRVKKGEKSHMVVFWKWIEQEDEETGEKKEIPFLRYYNVFHIDQCEGISPRHTETLHMPDGAEAIEEAQEIIYDYLSREGVKLTHTEGDRAFSPLMYIAIRPRTMVMLVILMRMGQISLYVTSQILAAKSPPTISATT